MKSLSDSFENITHKNPWWAAALWGGKRYQILILQVYMFAFIYSV